MTDTQFYVLITVLGTGLAGVGAAIRFSVNRVVKALDLNSTAMLDNTKSNAILTTKIETIAGYVQGRSRVSSEVKEFIREEISGVHEAAVVTTTLERETSTYGSEDPTPVEGGGVKKHLPRAPSVAGGGYGPTKRKDR